MMILNALRCYSNSISACRLSNWNRNDFLGYELYQSSVGIIGYGRIGQRLHHYLNSFDANVSIYDINQDYHSISQDSLFDLIDSSDIVVLCASHGISSKPILCQEHLLRLKDKHLVNISRGELIDQPYLLELIKINYFKTVSLDVLCSESDKSALADTLHQLSSYSNVFVSPHIGGYTLSSLNRTEIFVTKLFLQDSLL